MLIWGVGVVEIVFRNLSKFSSAKAGCVAKRGFLVEHSGRGLVLLDVSLFYKKPTRSSNRKTPPERSFTRKPFLAIHPVFTLPAMWKRVKP